MKLWASGPGNECRGSRKEFCSRCDCNQTNWIGFCRGAAMSLFAISQSLGNTSVRLKSILFWLWNLSSVLFKPLPSLWPVLACYALVLVSVTLLLGLGGIQHTEDLVLQRKTGMLVNTGLLSYLQLERNFQYLISKWYVEVYWTSKREIESLMNTSHSFIHATVCCYLLDLPGVKHYDQWD